MLVDRWADEAADVLTAAIRRDMTGAQRLLASRDFTENLVSSQADLTQQVAVAFASYPYPESFFVIENEASPSGILFNRADRPPPWSAGRAEGALYPVVAVDASPIASILLHRISGDAAARRQYSIFGVTLEGEPCQIVARLEYGDAFREKLLRATGFIVNLAWVRRMYFSEITTQVMRIVNRGVSMDVSIFDDRGRQVAGERLDGQGAVKTFPLLFAEPSLVMHRPGDPPLQSWSVRVSAQRGAALLWMTRGPRWTLWTIVGAAIALGVSLIVTTRAIVARAALAEMRSDFVSSVTHELKTPLATIRVVGETLLHGRVLGVDRVPEYGQLLVGEAKRLTRLVDNLLAYARVTDVTQIYSFDRLSPFELVDDALRGFRFQLAEGQFDVHVDVPSDLPLVRADRTAVCLAIDNLIDNAIRHSAEGRWLGISARVEQSRVQIEVRDRGAGIPPEEIQAVQHKFVRGKFARAGGSGLGLAIVNRIVADHGGHFSLERTADGGTVARLDFMAV
jgi:signal transduction histidine kinase